MNGYEAIAKIMKMEGIEWMACYPANPLIEATAKENIRPILFRHERGGIMAADGFSRQSSLPPFPPLRRGSSIMPSPSALSRIQRLIRS